MWQELKKEIGGFNEPKDKLNYLITEYKTAQNLRNQYIEKIKFYSDKNNKVEDKLQTTIYFKETLGYCENYIVLITDEIMRYENIVDEFNKLTIGLFDTEPEKKRKIDIIIGHWQEEKFCWHEDLQQLVNIILDLRNKTSIRPYNDNALKGLISDKFLFKCMPIKSFDLNTQFTRANKHFDEFNNYNIANIINPYIDDITDIISRLIN
ncbi:MAG: hypothetical protein EPN82_02460 [Bacteroidetes bacterium]|nr:MAG: hypothetical protein EPN82_02460 [Bacteroidota bacterium]